MLFRSGAIHVTDAAQAAPHKRIDVQALGTDFVAVSGHKMLGPSGIGFLWGKTELLLAMDPFLTGGHMIRRVRENESTWGELPHKFEAGTAPMAEAVGLGAAIDYLEEVGWMGPDVWLAHGIHFNDTEIQRLGRCEVGICHCPTSDMVLASGQCRTRELEKVGVAIGLGVDGSASNDSSNLMESARHALLVNRLTYDASVTHLDALRWASEGSARCLGRRDIGAIALGRQADLAFYTLDELRFSGAGDPIAALILCGAHRADRVMVAGRWLVEDGAPLGVDVERLRHEHGAMARRFLD